MAHLQAHGSQSGDCQNATLGAHGATTLFLMKITGFLISKKSNLIKNPKHILMVVKKETPKLSPIQG